VAIGLLGAVAVVAAFRERRRRLAVEAFREAEAAADGVPQRGDGPGEGWEREIDDDETVATINYEAPDERLDPPDG
jgi:hypothetical protein